MAEDRMALLEMLRKATADGDTDFLREGVRLLAQAVMEAEVSELTGVAKGERDPERRLTHRNGYRERRWDTRVGTIDWPSRGSATARTSRACSSPAGAPSGPSWRSSRRPTSRASHAPGGGPRPGPRASRASAGARSAGSAPRSTPRSRPSAPARSTRALPVSVARRHLPQGPRGRPRRVDGGARRDRRRGQRRAPGPRPRARRRQRRGQRLAGASSARSSSAACTVSGWSSATATAGSSRRSASGSWIVLAALPGALHPQRPGPRPALGPEHGRERHPARVRAARRGAPPGRQLGAVIDSLAPALPGGRRAADRRRARPARPLHVPRDATAARSAAPTRRSASTRRSSAGPASSGSSPTGRASSVWSGWSSPSRTTSGRTAAATSGPRPWPSSTPRRIRGGEPDPADGELIDQARGRRAVTPRVGTCRSVDNRCMNPTHRADCAATCAGYTSSTQRRSSGGPSHGPWGLAGAHDADRSLQGTEAPGAAAPKVVTAAFCLPPIPGLPTTGRTDDMTTTIVLGDGGLGRAVAEGVTERGGEVRVLGRPAGGVHEAAAFAGATLVVEASRGPSVLPNIRAAIDGGPRRFIIATTAWDADREEVQAILRRSGGAAVAAPNFSLGVALFTRFVDRRSGCSGASRRSTRTCSSGTAARRPIGHGTAGILAAASSSAPARRRARRSRSCPCVRAGTRDAPRRVRRPRRAVELRITARDRLGVRGRGPRRRRLADARAARHPASTRSIRSSTSSGGLPAAPIAA